MTLALILLGAACLAFVTYWWLERAGSQGWLAMGCRALAWSALGVLVLNLSCATGRAAGPPVVLLDASLSFASSQRWERLRDSLSNVGDLRYFGDRRSSQDSSPMRGRSLLAPALRAAAASERPVVVVTDGEVEDVPDIPADVLGRAGVRVFPREVRADVALFRIRGPERMTKGDSLSLEGEIRTSQAAVPRSVTVVLRAGTIRLARTRIDLETGGRQRFQLMAPTNRLAAGGHLLTVGLEDHVDEEPRNDTRLHYIEIIPTPGVVLLASPPDWDARFLLRTLRDVSDLPVRGYSRITGASWHAMEDLAPVRESVVRRAARGADLLVIKGKDEGFGPRSRTRAVLRWPSGENGETVLEGDWYVSAELGSPLAQAFLGLPIDSFPPATEVTPIRPTPGAWTALTAQAGRRGAPRPVIVGSETARRRQVVVAADGLWRWAFRGGSSEQGYRSWVAAALTWLLSGADTARGPAKPVRPVVQHSRPVVFRSSMGRPTESLTVEWSGMSVTRTDTLRFDGAGEAQVWLPSGEYRYRLSAGGQEGLIGVEQYSDEWAVRPAMLSTRDATAAERAGHVSARELWWLFGLCVLGLAGEWTVRRRMGLR
ncbi:MAG: hypothetical protein HKM89_00420 [Gemmatimonadales bacterium]|nr:hypothetical protein [Gemmatimonadales bacterium]